MDHPITMEGLLVQGPAERVRIILEPYCLDFEIGDVSEMEELPLPTHLIEGSAIPARVKLRIGARLLQFSSAEPYQHVLWKRRVPFALATQLAPEVQKAELKKREDEFFRARGLSERAS